MLRFIKFLNVIFMTASFGLAWYLYYADRIVAPYYRKGNWFVLLIFLIIYAILGRTYDAFIVSINRVSEMIYSQVLACVISDVLMYLIFMLLGKRFMNPVPLLGTLLIQIIISFFWSVLSNHWYYHFNPPKRSAVVYETREGMETLVEEYGLSKKFDIKKTLTAKSVINDLEQLKDIEAVFLSGVRSHKRNIILKYCMYNDIRVYVIPRIGDVIMSSAKRIHMFHLPMLMVNRYSPDPEYAFVKRLFDIVLSAIAIGILSPVMLITAIAIKKTDNGPVFYRQCRLTLNGKRFNVLKFRSMRVDAEKDGIARLSTGDKDDRITPIGRVIRKFRIDEIPQLINILKGDMSIVGPRPERPEIAEQYESEMPEFSLRLQVKAGLTGYGQVFGKYNTTPYDKLQLDLMYIAQANVWVDLKIMLATVKILFMPESTEGIAEGQTTAKK